MKYLLLIFLVISQISCKVKSKNYTRIIFDKDGINATNILYIDQAEKALIFWYLYAYGNECENNSSNIKCQLLKEMNIDDECETSHLNNLLQWFSNDMLAVYKLNKCPNLPSKSAIQNSFKQLILNRKNDTLSITFSVMGMNTLQEKSWNITQTDTYVINNNTFIKVNTNE